MTVGTGEKGIEKDTDQAIYLPKFSSDFFVSFKNLSFQWLGISVQAVDVPNDILKIKQEIDAELLVEDQTWGHNDANVSIVMLFVLACNSLMGM